MDYLTDRHINANDVAQSLIDDAIDGDGGFAYCSVAEDQFAQTAPESKHGVDHEQTGLYRLPDEIAIDNTRRPPALRGA